MCHGNKELTAGFKRFYQALLIIIHIQVVYTVCIKKRLVSENRISHNYSDLIVLKCVELMIRDKSVSYLQKRSIGHVP